jgi:uncharacterized MAPEG superfamily protein
MTTAFWCVLIAGLLPYAATLTAKIGAGGFDNSNPRDWLADQSGFRRRANAAQQNSFEAFPLFAVAVIVAHLAAAPQPRVDLLAVAFVVSRLLYVGCYVADLSTLRSLAWFGGIGSAVAIFLAAA